MAVERTAIKALRSVFLALILPVVGAASLVAPAAARAQAPSPVVTGVLVLITPKAGVTRDQVMAVMPAEIRQTVQLYLNGKIREWYSRADGRGVVLLLNASDVPEAQTIMQGLPLSKEHIVDYEYIAVGPLVPLRLLMASPAGKP